MSDDLQSRLAAAIERYVEILADHGLILDAECDSFVCEPVYGVHVILADAMQVLDPDYLMVERIQSTCGSEETHDRLEAQLVEFRSILEAICAEHQASTGIDPYQAIEDPTIGRVAVALLSVDIAAERLRAKIATYGDGVTDKARIVLGELTAEDNAAAVERHRLIRLAARP